MGITLKEPHMNDCKQTNNSNSVIVVNTQSSNDFPIVPEHLFFVVFVGGVCFIFYFLLFALSGSK